MKFTMPVSFCWLASLALLATPLVVSADKVTFSESRADKRVCYVYREDGETYRECEVVTRGSSKLVANVLWDGTPDVFDADTQFSLSFGDLSLNFALGDDPKWAHGKKSARFVISHEEEYGNEDHPRIRTIKDRIITLRWNAKGVTATVSSRINSETGPVIADYFSSNDPGPFTDGAVLSLTLGSFTAEKDVDLTGVVKHRTVGGEEEEVTLITVTVRGKLAPPVP